MYERFRDITFLLVESATLRPINAAIFFWNPIFFPAQSSVTKCRTCPTLLFHYQSGSNSLILFSRRDDCTAYQAKPKICFWFVEETLFCQRGRVSQPFWLHAVWSRNCLHEGWTAHKVLRNLSPPCTFPSLEIQGLSLHDTLYLDLKTGFFSRDNKCILLQLWTQQAFH